MLRKFVKFILKPFLVVPNIKFYKNGKNPLADALKTCLSVYVSKMCNTTYETMKKNGLVLAMYEKIDAVTIFEKLLEGHPCIAVHESENDIAILVIYGLVEDGFWIYNPENKRMVLKDEDVSNLIFLFTLERQT